MPIVIYLLYFYPLSNLIHIICFILFLWSTLVYMQNISQPYMSNIVQVHHLLIGGIYIYYNLFICWWWFVTATPAVKASGFLAWSLSNTDTTPLFTGSRPAGCVQRVGRSWQTSWAPWPAVTLATVASENRCPGVLATWRCGGEKPSFAPHPCSNGPKAYGHYMTLL
jgi:hypothetical protein